MTLLVSIFLKSHLEKIDNEFLIHSFLHSFIQKYVLTPTIQVCGYSQGKKQTNCSLGAYISKQGVQTQNKSVRCILHNMMINAKKTNKAGTGLVVSWKTCSRMASLRRWHLYKDTKEFVLQLIDTKSLFYSLQILNCFHIYHVVWTSPGRILQNRKMSIKDLPKVMQPI